MRDFTVLIIANSNSDLSLLKFNEFKIVNVLSEEFEIFCKKTFTRESEFLEKIKNDYQYDKTESYAIIKKENKKFGDRRIYNIYNFLLLLFPSSLLVEYILDYKIVNHDLRFLSSFHNDRKSYNTAEFLIFSNCDVEAINLFIEKHFENHLNINYIKSSILNYINAFDSNYTHFSFIALCICLESVTNGKTELIYRMARNIAVICGKDEMTSTIIFKNIKKIYNLRSDIVHGSNFSDDTINDYMYYLELICSKLIVELLKHSVNNIDSLNEKITSLGFGERSRISENWKETNFNKKIEIEIYNTI